MEINNKEIILAKIQSKFPSVSATTTFGCNSFIIPSSIWKEVCAMLRHNKEFNYNMLVTISAIDMEKAGIVLFAHLRSIPCNDEIIVKCILTEENPQVNSLCELWKSAELYEDEVYDLFGVEFLGHPFLRRIFLEEDFVGHPLKKDYVKVVEQ
ncbi:MAG: NADH-quinone oxidoreductase subunit C [Bacteroidales bacterium]